MLINNLIVIKKIIKGGELLKYLILFDSQIMGLLQTAWYTVYILKFEEIGRLFWFGKYS